MPINFSYVTSCTTSIKLQLRRTLQLLVILFSISNIAHAQLMKKKVIFTKEDTLRGSNNENRNWWDVFRYDITVKPNIETKEIDGKCKIDCRADKDGMMLQIDLQQPLVIDSIIRHDYYFPKSIKLPDGWTLYEKCHFVQTVNTALVKFKNKVKRGTGFEIIIYYHGKPKAAVNAPWDGGWIWKKDKNNNPFVSVAVQGLGASAWYPCKDYQADEPDYGANLTIIVPDSLQAIANGTNKQTIKQSNNQTAYTWQVKNPINNYCIIPYIGKYTNFTDTLMGEKGKLDLSYWVLDYNLDKAKEQFKQVKPMLRAMEYWFGAYPFYEDGYKLIEAPHLGMEHQSAVAYGNQYKNGYLGMDRSGKTGWGLKWDFIIIHESGHEWFANNITTKDIADMWVHEGFTTYSETLFTEYYYGKQAANEYNYGIRKNIRNDVPIIGPYGVNKEGSGDMYDKGSNMLHTIRHSINNDALFREILRGLNKTFYHQTVTTQQIESYIVKKAKFNYQPVFNQYLRTTQIPVLEYYFSEDKKQLSFKYSNCVDDFNLPLWLGEPNTLQKISPTTKWQTITLSTTKNIISNIEKLQQLYYLKVAKKENTN